MQPVPRGRGSADGCFTTCACRRRTVSCATCHRPSHAFLRADGDSTGINAAAAPARRLASSTWPRARCCRTGRTIGAPVLLGRPRDGSRGQVLAPIADANEMGLGHEAMVERFSGIAGYRPYFREAFGSDAITPRAGRGGAGRLRADAHERQCAVRSMGLRKDGGALSAQAQRGSDIVLLQRQLRHLPRRVQFLRRRVSQPRRRVECGDAVRLPTKAARSSPAIRAIAAPSRRPACARSRSARRTCTTDRSRPCGRWSNSTTVAACQARRPDAAPSSAEPHQLTAASRRSGRVPSLPRRRRLPGSAAGFFRAR